MKILKIIFFILIALFTITFLTLINSNQVTTKIFEYISQEVPIKYSKVEGSIYAGIKIVDLNTVLKIFANIIFPCYMV